MARFAFYPSFLAALFDEKHAIKAGGDTLKARLISTALDPTDEEWADLSADELATSGGYTAGGVTCSVTSATTANGVFTVVIASPSWTGSGAGFTFRSLVLFNDSAPNDELIGGIDFGRSIPIAASENTKTLNYTSFDEVNGLIIFGVDAVE